MNRSQLSIALPQGVPFRLRIAGVREFRVPGQDFLVNRIVTVGQIPTKKTGGDDGAPNFSLRFPGIRIFRSEVKHHPPGEAPPTASSWLNVGHKTPGVNSP